MIRSVTFGKKCMLVINDLNNLRKLYKGEYLIYSRKGAFIMQKILGVVVFGNSRLDLK